jgi:hypothetical protein
MSSGPVGLDVKEYTFGLYNYLVPDAFGHSISAHRNWLVTKFSFFCPNGGEIHIGGNVSNLLTVAAGGCLVVEPNGAHRGDFFVSSADQALLVIEYWFQATPYGGGPTVVIDA